MLKSTLLSLALVLAAAAGPALAADPTPHQIYEAVQAGQLQEAQQMIDQVLRDHPNSAQAHFDAAEVAAKRHAFAQARAELATAKRLAPGLPHENPAAVRALERQLYGSGGYYGRSTGPTVFTVPAPHRSSFPWGWILLFGGVIAFWMILRRRAAAYRSYPGAAPMGMPGPMGGPMGGPMMGGPMMGGGYGMPSGGSGILGGLASGLAVGAGVAAGEELVQHVLDGNQSGGFIPSAGASPVNYPDDSNADSGGADFGNADGSSWDDNSGGGGGWDDGGGGGWDSSGGGGDGWT